jgi:hypothetical protein
MKKNIASVLIVCLLYQFTGCYTIQQISKEELKSYNQPPSIRVVINDSTKYAFDSTYYYIKNDTIFGKGWMVLKDYDKVSEIDRTISLSDVGTIEARKYNEPLTMLCVVSVSAAFVILVYLGFKAWQEDLTKNTLKNIRL